MKLNEFHDVEELEIIGDQAKSMHKDHEVQMARSELYKAAKSAMALHDMLKHLPEDANIEGWVQAKITKAADYLSSVKSYLEYEQHSTGEITVDEMMPAPVIGESKKRRVAEGQINESVLSTDEIEAINQYLDDEISFHQLKLGYPLLIGNAARQFDHKFRNEMDFYDRMVQARDQGDIVKPGVAEGFGRYNVTIPSNLLRKIQQIFPKDSVDDIGEWYASAKEYDQPLTVKEYANWRKQGVAEGTKPDFLKGAKDLTPILKKEAKKRGEELYRDEAGVLQVRKLKKKPVSETASAGASGAGAVATSMGGGNGFKNGGPGTIKRESAMRKKGKK